MRARGYSLVELFVTLALSGATVIFALFTTVVAVRSAHRGALMQALSAECEVITLRMLDDVLHAGTHGDTRADVALTVARSDALSFVRPHAFDTTASDAEIANAPFAFATTRARVTWTKDGSSVWRSECAVVGDAMGDETAQPPCTRERVSANARRLMFTLLDDEGHEVAAPSATRVRVTLELAADDGSPDPLRITLVDEARLGALP
jgi:Tfp pilus assembly protein PilW